MWKIGKIFFKFVVTIAGVFLLFTILLASYIFIDLSPDTRPLKSPITVVNDITQLNPIKVKNVVQPISIKDIQQAIISSNGDISIGGGRYSQGGQTALENSLHLDMRKFNKVVSFAPDKFLITVQSGIRWRDILDVIDEENLSIKIMQTYSNFTVGGSLSVNVHGRYLGEGPIIRSVKSIKVILADGSIVDTSPINNSELFYGVIGGYGGLGVIVEATLQLVSNVKVERETNYMAVEDYTSFFQEHVGSRDEVVFHNADIYPPKYTRINSVTWIKTDKPLTVESRLIPRDKNYGWQPKVAKFVADSNFGLWMRQHVFEPILYSFDAVQWRNYEASYDVKELEPISRKNTSYALREYFVPVDHFESFASKMTQIFKRHDVNVLNVSIRHALPDNSSLLAWAKGEVFAFVVYYRQGTSDLEKEKVRAWSIGMIDAAISEGGAYYLPYQLHATTEQFHQAYPRANAFFKLKKKVDPANRFRNKLWEQHYVE